MTAADYDEHLKAVFAILLCGMNQAGLYEMLIDLRDESLRELHPSARILVYAVMLYPRKKRERNGVLNAAKREQLTEAAQARELAKARTGARVGLAGAILLRLIQIEEAGQKPSLNNASFLISVMWEEGWLTKPDSDAVLAAAAAGP